MFGFFRKAETTDGNEDGLNRNLITAIRENIQIALTLAYLECGAYRWIYQGSAGHGEVPLGLRPHIESAKRNFREENASFLPNTNDFNNFLGHFPKFWEQRNRCVGEWFRDLYPKKWQADLANEVFVRPEILRAGFLPRDQPLVLSSEGKLARVYLISFGKNALLRRNTHEASELEALCSKVDKPVHEARFKQLQLLFLGECLPPSGDQALPNGIPDNRIETIFRMWAAFRVAEVGLQDLAHRWQGYSHDYENCNVNGWIDTILTEESNKKKVNKIYTLAADVGLAVTLVQGAQAAFGIDSNRYSDAPPNNPNEILNNLVTDFESLKGKLLKRFEELKGIDGSMSLILSDYATTSRLNRVVDRPISSEAELFDLVVPIPGTDFRALPQEDIQAEDIQERPVTVKMALDILREAVRGDSVGTFLLDSLENLFNQAPSSK
jgi:hypothetical protein